MIEPPPFPFEHRRHGRDDGATHTEQVHLHDVPEQLLVIGPRLAFRNNSCIGDNDIDMAELADRGRDRGPQRRKITDIRRPCDHPPPQFGYLPGSFSKVIRRRHRVGNRVDLPGQIDGHDIGPVMRETQRVAASLTTGRARDKCDSARKVSQLASPNTPVRGIHHFHRISLVKVVREHVI